MWADMLLTHAGASPDPRDPTFYRPKTVHIRKCEYPVIRPLLYIK
jgi:hypothetical protein